MPVHNSNLLIKEARIKAGLTQEQLSEGICTPQADQIFLWTSGFRSEKLL